MEIPGVDDILTLEARIEAEYPDSFVTQVYNYLSLGYPSLARKYDEELSKITKIPVEEIRRNDGEVDKKGHIGTPEGTCDEEAEKGGRWEALRLYVREWARQQPGMISREEGWGTRIRRGSWAVWWRPLYQFVNIALLAMGGIWILAYRGRIWASAGVWDSLYPSGFG
jgi:hypothetical protein